MILKKKEKLTQMFPNETSPFRPTPTASSTYNIRLRSQHAAPNLANQPSPNFKYMEIAEITGDE